MSVTGTLIRAAQLLEQQAEELKAGSQVCGIAWDNRKDLERYYELRLVANQLRDRHRRDLQFDNNMSHALNTGDGAYRP